MAVSVSLCSTFQPIGKERMALLSRYIREIEGENNAGKRAFVCAMATFPSPDRRLSKEKSAQEVS